jgi:hypothetical protein
MGQREAVMGVTTEIGQGIADIADTARHRRHLENPKPLKHGGTEEAEAMVT